MVTIQYSIVSTSGMHYRDCRSIWEAFRLVRGYSERFVVQRRESTGHTSHFDRLGNETYLDQHLPTSEREAGRLLTFHKSRCDTCASGARCSQGEILVHNLIQTQHAAKERSNQA